MPTLDWIGKSKVVNHHLDVPYKVLERQYDWKEQGCESSFGRSVQGIGAAVQL